MKNFGLRIDGVARELGLKLTPYVYKVANGADFPAPIALFGTIKIWDEKAVQRYAKDRPNARKRKRQ